MRFEIENGDYVGSAEWQSPGKVALDIADAEQREFFERYFAAESSSMAGMVDAAGMVCERRDASEEAFNRSLFELAGYAYSVRRVNDARSTRYGPARTDYSVRADGARKRERQSEGRT